MAIPVEMPKMSDTMEEGVLVSWLVEEGATIAPGDIIAQVETDKATMDLESYDDGVLLKRIVKEGDSVPIGALIAVLGKADEDISGILDSYKGGATGDGQSGVEPKPADTEAGDDSSTAAAPTVVPSSDDGRTKSSPLARKLAREHGLDLATIRGSGPEGRVVKRDVEAAIGGDGGAVAADTAPARQAPRVDAPSARPAERPTDRKPVVQPTRFVEGDVADEVVALSQMRKSIARRLSESKFGAPHFYLTIDVDMSATIAARAEINALAEKFDRERISFNDFVTKACAVALRYHPDVNASFDEKGGSIAYHKQAHIAIAVAVDEGLITPVIRNADVKGLDAIAAETRVLAEKARTKKLQPDEYQGSTFTTSNLGMFGIQEFTAIINPPNSCILAIGAIRDEPVVRDGAVVPGKMMKVTLSCDHRVVDGATGARFLDTVRRHLEQPTTMLL